MIIQSQELMIALIERLAINFVGMVFRYGYDNTANQHIVEVQPHQSYDSEKYMLAEGEIMSEFHSHYETEGLLFTSNNPYITLPSIIYTATSQKITESSQFYHELSKKGLVININQPFDAQSVTDIFDCIGTDEGKPFLLGKNPENIVVLNASVIDANEYQYAMAA
ncbi:MAG: hypothetical protein EAY79_11480 [Runella slithyformis]|nr:MAG: hypothetical protein EAY79_11480 [Runella slithyformis]